VDATELAVMAELLLRGPQTIGELRGRAARMAPVADVAALKPVLATLADKGLVTALSPEGRGQIMTHTLYEPREMEQLRARHSGRATVAAAPPRAAACVTSSPPSGRQTPAAPAVAADGGQPVAIDEAAGLAALRREVSQLRDAVSRLRREIEDLWSNLRACRSPE
jgi:uncharacterized protein YceH (UPF0502 family)